MPDVDTERGDQVVDGAGGHAVDVGLHHDGVERLVDPPARLEDAREERALAQLRDAQLDVAGLGRHQPRTASRCGQWSGSRCARSGRRRSARLLRSRSTPASPDARHRGSRSTPSPARNASSSSDRTDCDRAIGAVSLSRSCRNTPRITPMAPPAGGPQPATPKPTTPRDAPSSASRSGAWWASPAPTAGRREMRTTSSTRHRMHVFPATRSRPHNVHRRRGCRKCRENGAGVWSSADSPSLGWWDKAASTKTGRSEAFGARSASPLMTIPESCGRGGG